MKPMDHTFATLPKAEIDPAYQAHDHVALEVAREGMVLLKNEGQILPLGKDAKINVFGDGFGKFRLGASGAGRINPRYSIRLFEGIEKYSTIQKNPELRKFYTMATNELPGEAVMADAKQWSEIAVITLTRGTSENYDNLAFRGEFYLTESEEKLIQTVSDTFAHTVLLINSGYPIDVRCAETYGIQSVLWTGLCGMNGGRAVAEILEGTVNPSGKLPDTWSLTWEEIPSSKNFYQPKSLDERINGGCRQYINTVYEEGLYVGYRYFDTFEKPVAYGFGHGLSYAQFSCECRLKDWNEIQGLDKTAFDIEVRVTNTGTDYSGKEVVQIYVSIPEVELEQPSRRLVGFAKTKLLAPGETQKLEIPIWGRQLASFDVKQAAWICETGKYKIYAGTSLANSVEISDKELTQRRTLVQSGNYMQLPEDFSLTTLSKKDANSTYPKGNESGMTEENHITPIVTNHFSAEKDPLTIHSENLITWDRVREDHNLLEVFVSQFSDYELARMAVCAKNGWGMEATGEAGRLFLLEKYHTPEFAFADGNNGVNLRKNNIGFPTSVTVCATFNETLAYDVGRVIAEEAVENEKQVILAPAANLHRNPLCGRNAEYFSEDPLLAGRMAGMQSKGLEEHGVASCMKHLAANNCESSRLRNNSIIDERTLRELYLKVFEEAFAVHKPATVMTSYNGINSIYGGANDDMLQKICIEEFGFEGFVMTDWTSCDTCDLVEAIAAGNGWITPGGMEDTQPMQIVEGIRDGRIERARLQKSVYRMMKVVLQFEHS